MTTFYMMVGLPGSGKSYWAREHAKPYDTIVSSDDIREELYGDASIQDDPARVFNVMFQRTRTSLEAGHTTFYDATNINTKRRINLLKSLKKLFPDLHCICVVVATPIDVCHERNKARERSVPDYVIERMAKQFEIPYDGEGWDEIIVDYYGNFNHYRDKYARLVDKFGDQNNSHHLLSLKNHCEVCGEIAFEHASNIDIVFAAYIHDYGKIYTATKWDKDNFKETHYPNHQNISAYLALIMGYHIHIAQLVGFHMIPYTDEKCQATWRTRIGEKLWEEVQQLHKFDVVAH